MYPFEIDKFELYPLSSRLFNNDYYQRLDISVEYATVLLVTPNNKQLLMTHSDILFFIIAKFLNERTKPDPGKHNRSDKDWGLLTFIPGEEVRDKIYNPCVT